jgi:propanol-preferring alcohol dehydrogenase
VGELPSLERTNIPEIKGQQVLVKVRACGLCASDIHAIHGTVKIAFLPITLGHEGSGVVEAVGDIAFQNIDEGERVVINYPGPCMKCVYCSAGEHNLCGNQKIVGFSADGTFAEYISVDSNSVVKLPATIDFPAGAICGCAVVTAYHALRKGGLNLAEKRNKKRKTSLAVIGVGGVGYHAILLADKIFNVEKITAIDISKTRLSLANRARATGTFVWPSAENMDIAKKVKEEASGLGHDVVCDFVGTNASIEFATRIARRGGRVVIVGISSDPLNTKIGTFNFANFH